ncbi:MAG: alpha-1,2-fucosyltransferase [Thiohalomonadaceae bacterium]
MGVKNRDHISNEIPDTIIVQLMGGLGNQLFQYAVGRRIAVANAFSLKLDVSWFMYHPRWFKYRPYRPYSLNHFATLKDVASFVEIAKLRGLTWAHLKDNLLRKVYVDRLPRKQTVVQERSVDFDPEILEVSSSTYLIGYWQSEKYFKEIEEIIRNEFTVITPPDPENARIAYEIKETEAICIHVRRGDYITDLKAKESLGLCSLDYYYRSIDYIMARVDKPHFYIFSDDPDWTQQYVTIDAPTTYVRNNPSDKNYEDLRLMTHCKHFIIANSSFSWWGAWLSSNRQKIVISPAQWFKGTKYCDDDRVPKEWVRL